MEEKGWVKRLKSLHKEVNGDELFGSCTAHNEGLDCCTEKKWLLDFIEQELDRAREEWTEELRQAFYDTFYKSGELWFDYLFVDGDTEAEQNAKEVVEEYWKEIIYKLTTK